MVKACKLNILSILYRLRWFLNNKWCTFESIYGKSNTELWKEQGRGFIGDIAYFTSKTIVAADGSSQSNNEALMTEYS